MEDGRPRPSRCEFVRQNLIQRRAETGEGARPPLLFPQKNYIRDVVAAGHREGFAIR
jgi:hypothetical protein